MPSKRIHLKKLVFSMLSSFLVLFGAYFVYQQGLIPSVIDTGEGGEVPVIIGDTLEEVIFQTERIDSHSIIHEEELADGVLVFYNPSLDSPLEEGSELAFEYIAKTNAGWEMSYKGGSYSDGTDQIVYMYDGKLNNDEYLLYGEVKHPQIIQLKIESTDGEVIEEASIVEIGPSPVVQEAMTIWYAIVEYKKAPAKIVGHAENNQILFTEEINIID